jgi:hypothetical protein
MTSEAHDPASPGEANGVEMPAPTFWPLIMAAAITLLGMGFVTSWLFTIIGAVVFVLALANWLLLLLPGRGHVHEEFDPRVRPQPIQPHGEVEHLRPGMAGHRLRYPEKVHPYSAGMKGGIFGGIAMSVPALVYGLISEHHSIWWPANLLAGMVSPLPVLPDGSINIPELAEFRLRWLLIGTVIHVVASISTGLIYGVLLPMLPGKHPIFWGGIVAPFLWSGAIHAFMGVLNPALQQAVNWPSFVVAQYVFGLVCGWVVVRSEKVYVAGEGPSGTGEGLT